MEQKYHDAIKKIVQLTKQDSEFDKELRKALGISTSEVKSVTVNGDVKEIEKYLGLDYYVDGQPSLIDYSFIVEPAIRNQLISDNREMMRYRYGTRFHIVDFGEYCRYAHLQVEMLLNYFYNKRNDGDLDKIKTHIKQFNPGINIDNSKSLGAISYSVKLWAFSQECGVTFKSRTCLENISKVRNNLSHRSPQEEENNIRDWRKQLQNMNIPLRDEGYVNTSKIKEGSMVETMYNNMVKSKDWYKDYCFFIWLKLEPYVNVKEAIEEICVILKHNSL